MTTHEFTCSQCLEHKTHTSDFTTGYGRDPETNKIICFDCAGENDAYALQNLKPKESIYLYLIKREGKYFLANWPSSFEIPIHRVTEGHNRIDIAFTYKGYWYSGYQKGDDNQICKVRKQS